jgi:dTDP-4-dehydrorhamnose reductase
MKPSILITGGAGLLAVNWAGAVKHRYAVTLGLHARRIHMDGVTCRAVQLDSIDKIAAAIRAIDAEIVIHSAAMTSVDACETAPESAHHANVEIARNVARACKAEGAKLVHISTDHVFDGRGSMMDEHASVQPINIYAKTKAAAEEAVLDACPDSIVARTNFFGWGPPYRKSFSDTIIETLREGREIGLFSDAYFTPILMDVLIEATHALIEKRSQGIFHIAGDERLSKFDFGLCIARAFDLDTSLIKPTYLATRRDLVPRPLDLSLSNKKMRNILNSKLPELSIDSQLRWFAKERANSFQLQVLL